jgi:uncharacterized Zn-finger protein
MNYSYPFVQQQMNFFQQQQQQLQLQFPMAPAFSNPADPSSMFGHFTVKPMETPQTTPTTKTNVTNSTAAGGSIKTKRSGSISSVVSTGGERQFPCQHPGCTLNFSRRHDLLRHMRIHNNDKQFRCDRCFKAFTRLDALTRHLKISEKYNGQCRIKRGRVPKCRSYNII